VKSDSVWSKLIEEDINHIYSNVKKNHPGFVDIENEYFKKWLERGYQEALVESKKAESLNDAMTILKTFVAGFADGHFYLSLDYRPKNIKWTGIEINKYGQDYRVSYTDLSRSNLMPAHMSKLISCDNKLVEDIITQDVLKFRFNAPKLNSPKVWYASEILIDNGIGKRNHFKSCKFENNGEIEEINISWSNIPHNKYLEKFSSDNALTKKTFNFESLGNKRYWITLPKFYPNKEEQKSLRDVIDKIKSVNGSASQFIIDVRGNGGGNSEWGVEVARAIYGKQYVDNYQQSNPDKSYALWRVSEDNAKHLKSILPWIEEQFSKDSSMFISFTKLLRDMEKAIVQGKVFVKQGGNEVNAPDDLGTYAQTTSNANVLFLTDSSCGSACLDFADLMLKLPNVYHIGQETAADTVYMDIRDVMLPSGLGQYSIAQKVYRGRSRKHNESYIPEYHYNSDIGNTESLKDWINTLTIK
jgi:hypothetical protein